MININYIEFVMKLQENLEEFSLPPDNGKQQQIRKRIADDLAIAVIELVLNLRPKLVLEIGAHEARFSREIKQKLPDSRVVAFEANPGVYGKYKKIIEPAGVEYLFQCIADENRLYDFSVPIKEGEGERVTMGSIHTDNVTKAYSTYQVKGRRLDDFLNNNIEANAMWVDVEGAIGSVLAGAKYTLRKTVLLFAELEATARWNGQMLDVDVIAELANYKLYPVLRDIHRHKWQCNIVFLHEDVLRSPAVLEICNRFINKTVNHVRNESN